MMHRVTKVHLVVLMMVTEKKQLTSSQKKTDAKVILGSSMLVQGIKTDILQMPILIGLTAINKSHLLGKATILINKTSPFKIYWEQ